MPQTNPIATVARPIQKAKDLAKTDSERFENIVKAGLTVPGLELKIVDSEDMSIEMPQDGEAQGELLARGPWITGDYYKLPEEDREGRFYEGWLVTGDIASIDAEGYLIIRDRSKDLIKSGGEWISSVDLENAIAALPGVAMACVVAMPHPRWDERPVAIVQVRRDPVAATQHCAAAWLSVIVCSDGAGLGGQRADQGGARRVPPQHAGLARPQGPPALPLPPQLASAGAYRPHRAQFAKFQLPDEILVWESIPMTSTGKMSKKDARDKMEGEGYELPDLRASL